MNNAIFEKILNCWFGPLNQANEFIPTEERQRRWWQKSAEFDAMLRQQFLQPMLQAAITAYPNPTLSPRQRLTIIILLDQFSRNCFRDSARMYAFDAIAMHHALYLINSNEEKQLHPIERVFVYMPLEHSEDIHLQNQCVELFEKLAYSVGDKHKDLFNGFIGFAIKHQQIIAKYGRFPHRNQLLGRTSTPEEITFLQQPGSSF